MPFTPSFSTSQSAGDLSVATFTDTSTGSDNTLTGRLLYLKKYDGNYLTPVNITSQYIFWPLASSSIDVDCLDKDYCLDITVIWFSGSTPAYQSEVITLFTGYGDVFLRQLTQALSANKKRINDYNFWYNKIKLRTLLDDAAQAVSLINDQTIAQFCLDESKKLTDNIQVFF